MRPSDCHRNQTVLAFMVLCESAADNSVMGTVNSKCLKIMKLASSHDMEIPLNQVAHTYNFFLYIKNGKR